MAKDWKDGEGSGNETAGEKVSSGRDVKKGRSADFKKQSQSNVEFAQGGDTPMFGEGDRTITASSEAAGEQKSGESGHSTSDGGGQFAKGGSNKMFGYTPAETARAGITSAR